MKNFVVDNVQLIQSKEDELVLLVKVRAFEPPPLVKRNVGRTDLDNFKGGWYEFAERMREMCEEM